MDRKKLILIAGGIAVIAAIVILLVLGGPRSQGAPSGTTSGDTTGSAPAPSTGDTVPETTVPETSAPAASEPEETQPRDTEPLYEEPEETTEPVYETALFPVVLEDGMLTVQSIFQFSGMNPDVDDLYGEDIAGLQMTNTSQEYLLWAEAAAILEDGTTLTFRAEDVPPGKTVMAFCLEHEALDRIESCEMVYGYAEFDPEDMMRTDLVRISVSGTEITVKNVSGRDLTNLNVYCHGVLDDSYFGGTTYRYTVESLPDGKSAVIHAVDCFLGMAEVVRVDLGG